MSLGYLVVGEVELYHECEAGEGSPVHGGEAAVAEVHLVYEDSDSWS